MVFLFFFFFTVVIIRPPCALDHYLYKSPCPGTSFVGKGSVNYTAILLASAHSQPCSVMLVLLEGFKFFAPVRRKYVTSCIWMPCDNGGFLKTMLFILSHHRMLCLYKFRL